jgi:glycosyltransferase involved in cell wall biosynthesis
MKVLMLAPHPFYQARGTPIAADLVLSVLSERGEQVDLVSFPEGSDVQYSGLTIHRTPSFSFVKDIRPGFSLKKIICDVFLLMQAVKLVRRDRYDLIHAGEEAVFIALLIKKLFGIPYIYDMDSSLVQQLIDKLPQLRLLEKPLRACEKLAVRNASAVLAVCQALQDEIAPYRPKKVAVIPDISLLNQPKRLLKASGKAEPPVEALREQFSIQGELLMYVGNLEGYQGIDLLLTSFAQALDQAPIAHLVIIGGTEADIHKYQTQAQQLNISAQVHFAGPKPVTQLKAYLDQADIVVSPRTQGNNTPMKLYSYLDSGKALLATNLATHTQVLSKQIGEQIGEQIAVLAEPETSAFAAGMVHLIQHPELRSQLAQSAQTYIARSHTYEAFARKLTALYDWVEADLANSPTPPVLAS